MGIKNYRYVGDVSPRAPCDATYLPLGLDRAKAGRAGAAAGPRLAWADRRPSARGQRPTARAIASERSLAWEAAASSAPIDGIDQRCEAASFCVARSPRNMPIKAAARRPAEESVFYLICSAAAISGL
jgi:hypothetical protein